MFLCVFLMFALMYLISDLDFNTEDNFEKQNKVITKLNNEIMSNEYTALIFLTNPSCECNSDQLRVISNLSAMNINVKFKLIANAESELLNKIDILHNLGIDVVPDKNGDIFTMYKIFDKETLYYQNGFALVDQDGKIVESQLTDLYADELIVTLKTVKLIDTDIVNSMVVTDVQNSQSSENVVIDVETVDVTGLKNKFDKLIVIDVRSKEEFDRGHLDGALLYPHDELLGNSSLVSSVFNNQVVLLYCGSGKRSEKVIEVVNKTCKNALIFHMYKGYDGMSDK